MSDYKFIDSAASLLVLRENPDFEFLFNRIESSYLPWNKVKYLTSNDDAAALWNEIKLIRKINSKKMTLEPTDISYSFGINEPLQQKLHYLDFNFGAGIQKEKLLSDLDKHQYLSNALMEESIFSSMIEGATTTRIVAKEMLRKGKKPINKSEQMILNNYKTIQYISEHKSEDITLKKLFEIHKLVTENTLDEEDCGIFRTSDNVFVMNQINGEIVHTPPPFEKLSEMMQSFCDFFNTNTKENFIHPIVKASILHFLVGYIHPFVDGNGRTARALFYWYLLKNGYWLAEYLSISRVILKSKTQYEKSFLNTEADGMDVSYFIHYQVTVLTKAFEDLKTYLVNKKAEENTLSKYLKISGINDRQAQILYWIEENANRYFSVKEIENIFKITNQTARTDIEELVEKNYLKKISINKKSFNYWKGTNFDKIDL